MHHKHGKRDRSVSVSSASSTASGREEVPTAPHAPICDAQLRDPMTTAIGFMLNPGPFRGCCRQTVACWDQAVYLEGELPCPSALPVPGSTALGGAPVLETNIGRHKIEKLRVFNIPHLGAKLDKWMAGLENLAVLHFENLSRLQTVGECWLYECTALTSVHFENLTSLQTVGHFWLSRCTALASVHFENLSSLQTVGDFWLEGCTALASVQFEGEISTDLVIPQHLQ
jgi:hypothetical protein